MRSVALRSLLLFTFLLLSSLAASASLKERLSLYTKRKGPGLGLLLVKDGKVIREEAYGYADIEKGIRIDKKTNFNIASNSKQFTAAAILLLEREKKIALEDLASKYIPELPKYAKALKVRHLLFHSSGLPEYMEICYEKKPQTNKDVLNYLRKEERALEFKPGTVYDYNNTGYVLLSEIVARVSGQPFYDFVQKNIFDKLGMKNSYVMQVADKSKGKKLAHAYSEWPFFQRKDSSSCDGIYGDGGVVTNLDDYAKWILALSRPGFFSKSDLKKIFTSGKLDNGEAADYSYGWDHDEIDGTSILVHTGTWLAFRSSIVYIPSEKTFAAMLSNYESTPSRSILEEILE